ncbi:hypothetical protein [Paenibacillus abyssi]|uniref:Uncharacterized protein n=1 Tax=Paenibacillus abyssi TaxID=1340531 RepID=A0A917D293_9BACL|nr:hypothetical protein [Paenibacillus abyssi]GGG06520.1 hypothetical protein GCM10010916_24310 [Paenibacillus abyssi]
MNAELLIAVSDKLNGRVLHPELLPYLEQFSACLPGMLDQVRSVSDGFPFDLEPAAVFVPVVTRA